MPVALLEQSGATGIEIFDNRDTYTRDGRQLLGLTFVSVLLIHPLFGLVISMNSQARISGVLSEFLLAKGSAEEDPLSHIDRPRSVGGKLLLRTASGPHLAAD